MWLSFLKSLLLIAACVFLSLKCFVSECVSFGFSSGSLRSFWRGVSLSLLQHFCYDARHVVFVRLLLTVQIGWHFSESVLNRRLCFCAKKDIIPDEIKSEIFSVSRFLIWRSKVTISEVETIILLIQQIFPLSCNIKLAK